MTWIPVGDDSAAWSGKHDYTSGAKLSRFNTAPEPLSPKVLLQQPQPKAELTINGQPIWPSRFDVLYGTDLQP